MDPRCQKPRDFVALSRNFSEGVRKERLLQMKWFKRYEWLLDEHAKLNKEMDKLCEEKHTIIATEKFIPEEGKTCLPAPITTSAEYGWLASKPKFQLEIYGSYTSVYPDPMRDIVHLRGNMPLLAAGKGFIW
ncbi:uncharacterized protein LOC143177691 [Calliopsis andreniformis]|uniref:uncharacterized protein LOC143177691 n=1 Tax=Calliopsis andreniformis TaxID=337506 RepID=UPI003FCDBBFD